MSPNNNNVERRNRRTTYLAGAASVLSLVAIGMWLFAPRPVLQPGGQVTIVQAPAAASTAAATGAPRSYRDAVEKAAPSVVNVYTAKRVPRGAQRYDNPLFRYYFGDEPPQEPATALGSGVIVSDKGYVLTNNHVVEGADQIAVVRADGKVAEARVVGTDPETDLAVLRISAEGLRPIVFGDSAALRVGDVVLAIGNPFGIGQTVTQGIVSATGRNRLGINTFENFIQTDAAINPGNSGGALVDADGNLVGINSAIFSQSGGSQGVGFAIPVSLAMQVMKDIVETGRVARGWLGIDVRDAAGPETPEAKGAFVAAVQRGGPAARAGLRPGDVLTSANGAPIADSAALLAAAAAVKPGQTVRLGVRRDSTATEIVVVAGERPRLRRQEPS